MVNSFVFEKHKIQTETLGEYLKLCRESLRLGMDEVSNKTAIKLQFIKYLEDGRVIKLPPDVYVLGFLRKLAKLYGVDSEVLVEQYKKERKIAVKVRQRNPNEDGWLGRVLKGIIITPKKISILAGVLFTVLTVGYIVYQVFSINRTPALVIFEPRDRQIIIDSFVNVRGRTDPGMSVTVNGQEIFVDRNGEFRTQLGITPGPRDLKVASRNKFDKEAVAVVSVVGQSSAPAAQAAGLRLKLDFSADVNLSFAIDGAQEQSLSFHGGESKLLSADRKIIISTSDAGATKVTLNGQVLGNLGRPKEPLANIPFFAEYDNAKSQ